MIETSRLSLIPCQPSYLHALAKGRQHLSNLLNVSISEGWPQFPAAYQSPQGDSRDSAQYHWGTLFYILKSESCLIGSGGFKGSPDSSGIVEFGYEIAPEFWNRGFATEATLAMRDYAFSQNSVKKIIAHTLAEDNASNRVLRKAGLTFECVVPDSSLGSIWRWQISRKE